MRNSEQFEIAVAGTGYVGLSIAVLLAQHHRVTAVDILPEKVDLLRQHKSPVQDEYIEAYLDGHSLNLEATLDAKSAYTKADYVIIAVPTNYDSQTGAFDTSAVENVIDLVLEVNPHAVMVIKSTVPIGYTQFIRQKKKTNRILFSPEFLRESMALYDNLYPSRIIVSSDLSTELYARTFAGLLCQGAAKQPASTLFMGSTEAEAVKLFSDTYHAMRISYFNELDTYAELQGLDSKQIIQGVCADPRIGAHYNNPSFGYGGYCLPKDTKQLLTCYQNIPETLIQAIVDSNCIRKAYIASHALDLFQSKSGPAAVGIYRLTMKSRSDNFRQSAVQDIAAQIQSQGVPVIVYEPTLGNQKRYSNYEVVNDLPEFKSRSRIILANRWDDCLSDVKDKVYTRDVFQRD